MITPLDLTVTDNTLFTVALVLFIIVCALYILSFILGRWRP